MTSGWHDGPDPYLDWGSEPRGSGRDLEHASRPVGLYDLAEMALDGSRDQWPGLLTEVKRLGARKGGLDSDEEFPAMGASGRIDAGLMQGSVRCGSV